MSTRIAKYIVLLLFSLIVFVVVFEDTDTKFGITARVLAQASCTISANLSLQIPVIGDQVNWGTCIDNDLAILDALFGVNGQAVRKPDFLASTQFASGTCAGGVPCVDTNDGFTLGSAKLTMTAACQALPFGAPGFCGSGTMYVAPGAKANAVLGKGFLLLGSGDPNFSNPPSGFMKCIGSPHFCTMNIIGLPNQNMGPNSDRPQVYVPGGINSQSGADINNPGLWLAGIWGPIYMENIFLPGQGRGGVIGECSNNDRSSTCRDAGIYLENVGFGLGNSDDTGGNASPGPCLDIPGYELWIVLDDVSCSSNGLNTLWPAHATITNYTSSVGANSSTLTCNVALCGLPAGYTGFVHLNSNALAACQGFQTVTSVTGNTMVLFGAGCPSPGGSVSGSWPLAIAGDWQANQSAAILFDGNTSPGSGIIKIRNAHLAGGGIKFIPGAAGGGNISVFGASEESGASPVLWITGGTTTGEVHGLAQSDAFGTAPAYQNDSGQTRLGTFTVTDANGVVGPAVVLSQDGAFSSLFHPLLQYQQGFFNGFVVGESEADHLAPLVSVRQKNYGNNDSSIWQFTSPGTTVLAPNQADPFGGTTATQITTNSTGGYQIAALGLCAPNVTLTVGTWIIGGASVLGKNTDRIIIPACLAVSDFENTGAVYYGNGPVAGATGDWNFNWFANKITATQANNFVGIGARYVNTFQPTIYGPDLFIFPPGTISDADAIKFAKSLSSVNFNAPIGSIAGMEGKPLSVSSYRTLSNCAAVGTSASPSVVACGSAAAGYFSCATAATGATCQVNTTKVTATSEIFVQESDTTATGTALGVTCNTSTNVLPTSRLLASWVAGTSFTINLGTVTTNPACFSYHIIN